MIQVKTLEGESRSSIDLKPLKLILKDLETASKYAEENLVKKSASSLEELNPLIEEITKTLNVLINTDLKEIKEISNEFQKKSIIDIEDKLNYFMKIFSSFSKSISFQSNFDGYIATVKFPPVSDPSLGVLRIQHFLGITPKWRVILRQEGNGVLTDIPSEWNEDIITMKNNGSVAITASILIARE